MKNSQNQEKSTETSRGLIRQLEKNNPNFLQHLISDPEKGKRWVEDSLIMIKDNEQLEDSEESRMANVILAQGINIVIVVCGLDMPLLSEELEREGSKN